jgi:hypothetical protein
VIVAAPVAAPESGSPGVRDDRGALITHVEIQHYKSVRELDLDLGRVNVFIGENGSGKSNILEAIALGAAASRDKLDHEYLVARGVRMTPPALMLPAFAPEPDGGTTSAESTWGPAIRIDYARGVEERRAVIIAPVDDEVDGPSWMVADSEGDSFRQFIGELSGAGASSSRPTSVLPLGVRHFEIPAFLTYAPEYSALRRFEEEGALRPLGVRGEGLLEHLQELAAQPGAPAIATINEHLALLDWFERLEVPSPDLAGRALRLRDRFLAEGVVFDQRSANEGFLFLLFYLTLVISPRTPRFFAIDNLDTSLNPKLCQALMSSLVTLAKRHRKQLIVTTHNPSVLDGLDLHDDEQRLFVIARDDDGATQAHRMSPPKRLGDEPPVRLSTAFLRGYLGGLPKNF